MVLFDLLDDGVWGCDFEFRGGGDIREEKVIVKYILNGVYIVIIYIGFYFNKWLICFKLYFK